MRPDGGIPQTSSPAAVLLVLALAAGCALVTVPAASHRLGHEVDEIRASGGPMTFDELRATATSGEGPDAADAYRAAASMLSAMEAKPLFELVRAYRSGFSRCPQVLPGDDVRARARRILIEATPALEALDHGARLDRCRYAFDLEASGRSFAAFRTGAALLSLRTLELHAAGEAERAVSSLISALRLLRVFETEPVLITQMVRLVLWQQPCIDLGAVLGSDVPEQLLDRLDAAFEAADQPELLKRTMQGERVWDLRLFAAILGPDWPATDGLPPTKRLPLRQRARELNLAAEILAEMSAMVHVADDPWPGPLAAVRRMGEEPFVPITVVERTAQVVAAARAGRVAIAIARFRRRRGSVPTSLGALGIPVPIDPYTGEDLLYQLTADSFVVAGAARPVGEHGDVFAFDDKGRPQGVQVCTAARHRTNHRQGKGR